MRIDKPLWHDGVTLRHHHLQQQERWIDFAHRQFASASIIDEWGALGVKLAEELLGTGRLKLRFPDGMPFDTAVADPLPPARDLAQGAPAGVQSVVVLAALPLPDATGNNCRFDEASLARTGSSSRSPIRTARRMSRLPPRSCCAPGYQV
jgi:type VI secretion system protein ImpJ